MLAFMSWMSTETGSYFVRQDAALGGPLVLISRLSNFVMLLTSYKLKNQKTSTLRSRDQQKADIRTFICIAENILLIRDRLRPLFCVRFWFVHQAHFKLVHTLEPR